MCVLGASLQLQQAAGGAPLPVALKVMDCNEDDACSFERVYNEVRRSNRAGQGMRMGLDWPDAVCYGCFDDL